jgi:isoleucyl-tRNA synthetase
MSKSKGSVVDPFDVLDAQGADALRWFLFASSPPESSKRFSQTLVEETLRDFFMTLWNTAGFFTLYANLDRPDLTSPLPVADRPAIDRWLVARTHAVVRDVTAALERFDATGACRTLRDFVVDDVSNWYVRRNRRRFWKGDGGEDARSAYRTLHETLVTTAQLIAPMAPFTAEALYQNLVRRVDPAAPASVHLAEWPTHDPNLLDEGLVRDMETLVRLVELGRSARAASGHKVRQPLPEVLVRVRSSDERAGIERLEEHLLEELNVKAVRHLDPTADFVDYLVKPNLPLVGKRFGKRVPALRAALQEADGRDIARRVRDALPIPLVVDGEAVELEPEAVLLDVRSPEGYVAVEERGYLAALTVTLTPELVREGIVRDVVRLVQDARKGAGLMVSDRIVLGLEGDGALVRAALEEGRSLVASETLAEELGWTKVPEATYETTAEVGDGEVRISLRRRA